MTSSPTLRLAEVTTTTHGIGMPELGRLIQPRALGRWSRRAYGAIEPPTLHAILRDLESGYVEDWVDLCSYMLRTDAHLRSVYSTRIAALVGAPLEVEPSVNGDPVLAAEVASAFADELARVNDLEQLIADLAHGIGIGWAFAEHDWTRRDGRWTSTPLWLHPRETRARTDHSFELRDWRTGPARSSSGYVSPTDHPGKFIAHSPRNIADVPTLTGDLIACAWPWLFKRWGEKLNLTALERFAEPLVYGIVAPNAVEDPVRRNVREGLESMSGGTAAVFEQLPGGSDPVRMLETSKQTGDAWGSAIDRWDAAITKALLGSTDAVEAEGGSYARAEVQVSATMLPRLMSDARRLAGTLERDWAAWWCRYNAHLFGGRIPPTPKLTFALIQEEANRSEIFAYHMRGKLVTRDEVRAQLGLEPLGAERGGDELLNIVEDLAPASAGGFAPMGVAGGGALDVANTDVLEDKRRRGGDDAAAPFARHRLPLTSPTTSRTSSRSRPNPIASALSGRSVGRRT